VLDEFMEEIGRIAKRPVTICFAGGSTAVLLGFRDGTIEIDLAGALGRVYAEIPRIKERLRVNVGTAKPTDFVPSLEGEASRHLFIRAEGKATFLHFDPYAQAFSKIVRGHVTDLADADSLMAAGLVDPQRLLRLVKKVTDRAFARYTRLTRASVEAAVESFVRDRLRKR
jgi:hypothetical protein